MTYSLWPWRLITFAAPDFFGNPGRGTYWGYATYWEDAGYVGVLPLLLVVWAVIAGVSGKWRRSETKRVADCKLQIADRRLQVAGSTFGALPSARSLTVFWASAALVALVLALGKNTPVFPFLFHHLPGFDLFQAPARWLAVTTIALAVLAAVGAHHWPRGRRGRRLGALAATVGGALLIGGLTTPRLLPDIPSTFGPATARLGTMLIFAGALTLLRMRRRDIRRGALTDYTAWWRAAAGIFVGLDLLTFGWSLMPAVDRTLYRGKTNTVEVLGSQHEHTRVYWPTDPDHQHPDHDAQYRVKFDYLTFDDFGPHDAAYWRGIREAQLPNAGMLDRVAATNNFDPLLVGRYSELLEAAVETPGLLQAMGVTHIASDRPWPSGEPSYSSGPVTFYRLPDPLGRAWIVTQARRVAAESMLETLTDPTFDPGTEVLLEVEPRLGSHSQRPADASRILFLRDSPNGVTIRGSLEAPGYLVLADTWYPGWDATVDGERAELLQVNHAFRAVQLEAGKHVVEMVYRPASVLIGGLISLTGAALLISWVVIARNERE
jgi:hypothetical protein